MDTVAVRPTSAPLLARRKAGTDATEQTRPKVALTIALLACHIPLGVAMRDFHVIATMHAVACLAVGLVLAATTRKMQTLAPVLAYIAGSEVLWRMNRAGVLWEFGKYAAIAILLLALTRTRLRRNRGLPLAYFLLLLPSVLLTFVSLGLGAARQEVSFTLSGPVALTLGVLFFSNIRMNRRYLERSFLAFIAPTIAIATLALASTLTHRDIEFIDSANFITSAGFGPNQVAATLGLAVMFALLMVIDRKVPWRLRLVLFALATVFSTQAALTFARGGLLLALCGFVAALLYMLRGNARAKITVILIGGLTVLIGKYAIEPRLESFTGGELTRRYENTKSDGRNLVIASEMKFFEEHPIMGVGPGMGTEIRIHSDDMFHGASHTEYTRMLAEHGIFGVLSLVCLVLLGVRPIRRGKTTQARALAAAMVTWAALFLLIYSTRMFAPALLVGLAYAAQAAAETPRAPMHHLALS